jgi:hypothetical protein
MYVFLGIDKETGSKAELISLLSTDSPEPGIAAVSYTLPPGKGVVTNKMKLPQAWKHWEH